MTDQPTSADFQHAQLDWDADGQPRSCQFADVYFANDGGLAEARHAFLLQNDLARRFAELAAGEQLVIGETGFGTRLNFLLSFHVITNAVLITPSGIAIVSCVRSSSDPSSSKLRPFERI